MGDGGCLPVDDPELEPQSLRSGRHGLVRKVLDVPPSMTDEEIATAYEENTGHAITRLFKNIDPSEVPAVLVANHAPFTWGATPAEASQNAVILEAVAKMAYLATQIHPNASPTGRALHEKHFLRKHGTGAYYGQPKDKK